MTHCPIQPYVDDITLHYSTSFDRRPNLLELQILRNDAAERLTSDTYHFRLGQEKCGFFQCLKYSISSSISSTISSTQQSPILQQHTAVSLSHAKRPWSLLYPDSQLEISYKISCYSFLEVRCSVSSSAIFLPQSIAYNTQGPCPPLYGVCMPCVGRFNTFSSGQSVVKGFSYHQTPYSY